MRPPTAANKQRQAATKQLRRSGRVHAERERDRQTDDPEALSPAASPHHALMPSRDFALAYLHQLSVRAAVRGQAGRQLGLIRPGVAGVVGECLLCVEASWVLCFSGLLLADESFERMMSPTRTYTDSPLPIKKNKTGRTKQPQGSSSSSSSSSRRRKRGSSWRQAAGARRGKPWSTRARHQSARAAATRTSRCVSRCREGRAGTRPN